MSCNESSLRDVFHVLQATGHGYRVLSKEGSISNMLSTLIQLVDFARYVFPQILMSTIKLANSSYFIEKF